MTRIPLAVLVAACLAATPEAAARSARFEIGEPGGILHQPREALRDTIARRQLQDANAQVWLSRLCLAPATR